MACVVCGDWGWTGLASRNGVEVCRPCLRDLAGSIGYGLYQEQSDYALSMRASSPPPPADQAPPGAPERREGYQGAGG